MRVPFLKKRAPDLGSVPVTVPSLTSADLAAVYYGERIGGDFYDFVRVTPRLVLFGLLDVAGRHEENGEIVAEAGKTLRTLGAELFARDEVNEADAMIELSLELNRAIMAAAGGVRSCPGFVACYNEEIGTVCYSNAGHTPALLRDQSGITQLPASGLPFGLFSHVTHDALIAALPPGAAFLLVSRGVTEARHRGKEFGLDGVQASFQQTAIASAEQLCDDILNSVEQFTRKPPTHNDVTALALVRAAAAKPATPNG